MRLPLHRVVLLWIAAALCSAPSNAGRLPFRIYRTVQGLPRNSVTCMVAGQNGIMWFCTTEGLARFDGHEFRVFGPQQGLPSRTVYGFFPSRVGGYWVITDRGLCRLPAAAKIGDSCRPFAQTPPAAWFDGFLSESPTGEVWAANEKRVFRVRPQNGTLEDIGFPMIPFVHVLAIAAGDAGTVLIGTEQGVFEWSPPGQLRHLTEGMDNMGSSTIIRLASGDYWLSTARGLFRLRLRGEARTPEFRSGWLADSHTNNVDRRTYYLIAMHDGSLWVNTGYGVTQLTVDDAGDAHMVRHIDLKDDLPGSFLEKIAEDGAGHLWISAEAAGVLQFEENGFTNYGAAEGLGPARIDSIFAD
jgi:ligand-binding sensor domain-containing protein